jgi:DNA-binding NarL/FixJ family response regulator
MGSVLVVTAVPIIRVGLRVLLHEKLEMFDVHEASSASEALRCVAGDLALIILDPETPDVNMPEFMRQLRRQSGHTPILFFGGRSAAMFASLAFKLGADGYLGRLSDETTIVAAIHTLLGGMQCFPRHNVSHQLPDKMQALSSREVAVLLMLRQGLRNKDVARKLHLSEKTISAHKRNALHKLQISVVSQISDHELATGL